MKSDISLLALICMMLSLTQPAWSMDKDNLLSESSQISTVKRPRDEGEIHFNPTLMGMPEEIQARIFSFIKMPSDIGLLLLLNKSTNHLMNQTFLDTPEKKISFLMAAADRGNARCQYELGMRYQCGNLVQKNLMQEIKYLILAADGDHPFAQIELGLLYKQEYKKNNQENDREKPFFGQQKLRRVTLKET